MILNSVTAYFLDLWRTTVCEPCKPCLQAVYLGFSVNPGLSESIGEQLREHKEGDRDISRHCEKKDSGMSH